MDNTFTNETGTYRPETRIDGSGNPYAVNIRISEPKVDLPKVPAPTVVTSQQANEQVNNAQNTVNTFGIDPATGKSSVTKKAETDTKSNTDQLQSEYNTYKATVDRINAGTLTPEQSKMIENLKSTFEQTRELQKAVNENFTAGTTVLGIRKGRNRYATEIEQGNIKDSIDQGIAKLADIDLKEAQAVSEMRIALLDKDFERATKTYSVYNDFIKQKNDTIFNLLGAAQRDQQIYLDQIKANQTELTKNYEFAVANGYDGSLVEFKKEMESSPVKPTALIQNYEYAKSEGYTGSFTQYQAMLKTVAKTVKNPAVITSADAERFGLPKSIVGKPELDIIKDVSVTNPPSWFKDMLSETEPDKTFSPEGVKSVWETFRNREDVKVLRNMVDLNKAQAGKFQEGEDLDAAVAAGIASALADEE
jgi:hypothetical protein